MNYELNSSVSVDDNASDGADFFGTSPVIRRMAAPACRDNLQHLRQVNHRPLRHDPIGQALVMQQSRLVRGVANLRR